MAINHIKNKTARVTQGGYAILDSQWRDSGVLLEDSKLFYITDGEIIIRVKDFETVCRKGDMVLIPAGTSHDYYLSHLARASKFWFHFSIENESDSIFRYYDCPIKIAVSGSDDEKIRRLFSTVTDRAQKSEADELLKLGAIFELVHFYIERSGAARREEGGDEIDRVLRFINANLALDLSLPQLAAVACLSKNYFIRKFRSRVGIAPQKYVSMARIERAKLLLANSNSQVSEVMADVGFTDSAHFSKAFKASTGYSPRAYKKVAVHYL